MKKFPLGVAEKIRSYVYIYSDPRNGKPFYVGKGRGNRIFSHLKKSGETEKFEKIEKIQKTGREPKIEILRYGLSDSEAKLLEASTIDLLGIDNLTNAVGGERSHQFGRNTVKEIALRMTAKKVKVKHRALLITINQLYEKDMTPTKLLEATRGVWKLGKRREKVEIAMAVYQGIVREVYRVEEWFPAGTQHYRTRPDINKIKKSRRWEFKGKIAGVKLRRQYLHKSVGKSGQNPIRYKNC
jgi:hypothetical protein